MSVLFELKHQHLMNECNINVKSFVSIPLEWASTLILKIILCRFSDAGDLSRETPCVN
jgi:hypothetical protein